MKGIPFYWIISLIVMLGILLAIGGKINGRWLGILIDSRKKMSLSRLQLVVWSWLIISSFFAIGIATHSMNIELTPQVWALLGISIGSTAGSIAIKGKKQAQNLLNSKNSIADANLADIFKGEEETDYDYVDMTKTQMFFFSLAAFFGYAWALWYADLSVKDGLIKFPELSPSMLTIIGISHAGYLAGKAVTKS